MQTIICDACGKSTESPIAVEWDRPDADDDDIVWSEEAHACSFECLASWAMTQHLRMADQ